MVASISRAASRAAALLLRHPGGRHPAMLPSYKQTVKPVFLCGRPPPVPGCSRGTPIEHAGPDAGGRAVRVRRVARRGHAPLPRAPPAGSTPRPPTRTTSATPASPSCSGPSARGATSGRRSAASYGFQTYVGARTFVNVGLVCLDVARVTIGDDVQIGPGVQLLTADPPARAGTAPRQVGVRRADHHRRQRVARRSRGRVPRRSRSAEDTVVGAGSVVTRDLPAGVLAVGNPARVVRRIAEPPAADRG